MLFSGVTNNPVNDGKNAHRSLSRAQSDKDLKKQDLKTRIDQLKSNMNTSSDAGVDILPELSRRSERVNSHTQISKGKDTFGTSQTFDEPRLSHKNFKILTINEESPPNKKVSVRRSISRDKQPEFGGARNSITSKVKWLEKRNMVSWN